MSGKIGLGAFAKVILPWFFAVGAHEEADQQLNRKQHARVQRHDRSALYFSQGRVCEVSKSQDLSGKTSSTKACAALAGVPMKGGCAFFFVGSKMDHLSIEFNEGAHLRGS